jgi:hypothetical protein
LDIQYIYSQGQSTGPRKFGFRLLSPGETTTKIPRFSFRFLNRDAEAPLEDALRAVGQERRRDPSKREEEVDHVGQEYSHHYRQHILTQSL